MKILAFNSGSSSIKYRLFGSENGRDFQLLEQGAAERIGQKNSSISYTQTDQSLHKEEIFLPNHRKAIQTLFLNRNEALEEVDAVGHRVVHGGEQFKKPVLINKEVLQQIAEFAQFAPLHSEPNIAGIQALQELLPDIPHVAVFDTSAHATMEPKAFLYGIPLEYYEKYRIRKYGFHGINHLYIAKEAARLIKRPFVELKIITCHLGNGCSINAFEKGKSIDNSMGFTPLEGVVMGTRCGDLDPSVILYLFEKLGLEIDQMKDLLNKNSGLLGLCGKSDMRDILAMAKRGDQPAQIAIDTFVYRIQKYVGGYTAALNGVDAIVFSGGIGENSAEIRSLAMKNFSYLGATVDGKKNQNNDPIFSTSDSRIFLMAIPANEERVIAKETYQLVKHEV